MTLALLMRILYLEFLEPGETGSKAGNVYVACTNLSYGMSRRQLLSGRLPTRRLFPDIAQPNAIENSSPKTLTAETRKAKMFTLRTQNILSSLLREEKRYQNLLHARHFKTMKT